MDCNSLTWGRTFMRSRVRWIRHVVFALAVATCAIAAHGTVPAPFFTCAPVNVFAGGAIKVTGSGWDPSARVAIVSITHMNGGATVLGTAPIAADGTISKRFTIPSTSPGPHHVNAQDANGHFAINLHGPVEILSDSRAWFGFRPWVAGPGDTASLFAGGFRPGTTGAAYGLISRAGQLTILGAAAVGPDGFAQTFTIPASLPPGAYYPFVIDSGQQSAFNATGVLTIGSDFPTTDIPVGRYPIGAAVNQLTGLVYIPNGADNTVSVIDESSLTVIATIPAGALPCAVAINSVTNRVYVANVNTNSVTVIDGSTNAVVATVPAGRAPCAIAVLPQLNRVFVGNYYGNSVTVIDGASNAIVGTLPIAAPPYAVAANGVTNEVFVALGHTHGLAVIGGASLATEATIPVGLAPDAIGVDESTNRVYVGNYLSHSLSVIDAAARQVIGTIPVGVQPSGVAVDPQLQLVFVSNWESDTVTVVDAETLTVIADLPAGDTPDGGAVSSTTHRAYMVNSNSNNVTVIDGGLLRRSAHAR
jgi:YVTN family beta-propeller protein